MSTIPRAGAPPSPPPTLDIGAVWRAFERVIDRMPLLEKEMLLLAALVQPGWVCVDVGAAGGTCTHLLSRRATDRGHVLAVEPRGGSMRQLRRLRRWLSWRNVSLHQVALADRSGRAALAVPRIIKTEARLVHDTHPDASEVVTTTTLDALLAESRHERLDLITCDVEGAELQVLAGAERSIERFRPVVVCEVERRHLRRFDRTPDQVVEWFAARDYVPFRYARGRLERVRAVTDDDNDYVFWPTRPPDR